MVGSGCVGSTLERDSEYINNKIGYYPKSLRPFLRILCVVDNSHIYVQKKLLLRSTKTPSAPSLRFDRNDRTWLEPRIVLITMGQLIIIILRYPGSDFSIRKLKKDDTGLKSYVEIAFATES